MTKTYTFTELTQCDWSTVSKKHFRRVDTGELVGEIFAKYPIYCGKLSAMMNNGRLEFLLRSHCREGRDKYTVLFGSQFAEDAACFEEVSRPTVNEPMDMICLSYSKCK
jgi:hypothetical protein